MMVRTFSLVVVPGVDKLLLELKATMHDELFHQSLLMSLFDQVVLQDSRVYTISKSCLVLQLIAIQKVLRWNKNYSTILFGNFSPQAC